MKHFRVIFMGTPNFAVPVLAALHAATEVVCVVTQPDKKSGRGQKVMPPPVKLWAQAHGIEVFQPARVRTTDAISRLRGYHPDMIIVAAFGQILPQEVLDIPQYGCINIHASLLPAYRGASPIQQAIMDGCAKTGVTIMQMDAGLDTGDILTTAEYFIAPEATYSEVHDGLRNLGAATLIETLEALSSGKVTAKKQVGKSSYAPMLTKDETRIRWGSSSQQVHDLVRALDASPGALAKLDGKTYKIWRTRMTERPTQAAPGTILAADKKRGFFVATGDMELEILELQAPGKKRMLAAEYLNGHEIALPAKFEDVQP